MVHNAKFCYVARMKALLVFAILVSSACGGKKMDPADPAAAGSASQATLYVRLGGEPAVKAVVKDFVENVAKDARVNTFFKNTDIPNLEKLLFEQICAATGGGCTYTGRDMKTTHTGMKITEAQFNAVVEDLTKSLDKFQVKEAEKTELLTALGSMKGDIVGL